MELVAQVINKVADISTRFQIATLDAEIHACRHLLADENGLDVVVLGGFKTGKSSFLNRSPNGPSCPWVCCQ